MEKLSYVIRAVIFCVTVTVLILGCGKEKGGNELMERTGIITFKGNPLTLIGNEVKVGDRMLDCTVVDKNLEPVKFSSFKGKVCIITCFPSLDTSVCDIMTRKFNEEAVALGDNVVVLAISMDLPFAQDRWCIAADVKNVHMLSDHRDASFGRAFGVLIKELRLLARAVFVIDRDGIVKYMQIVPELTHEPDYEPVLNATKELL